VAKYPLQLIGGLDQPTTGSITVNGVDIHHLRDKKLSAFVTKALGCFSILFYSHFTTRTNVEVPGMFRHVTQKSAPFMQGHFLKK